MAGNVVTAAKHVAGNKSPVLKMALASIEYNRNNGERK